MRLEAIEKEADLYRGEGECYIHIERTKNSPLVCVMAGDRAAVSQAVYNILLETARQLDVPFASVLKMYKRAYKQFGIPNRQLVKDE